MRTSCCPRCASNSAAIRKNKNWAGLPPQPLLLQLSERFFRRNFLPPPVMLKPGMAVGRSMLRLLPIVCSFIFMPFIS